MHLATITRYYQSIDDYTLVAHQGHILWDAVVFPHISSEALWHDCQQLVQGFPEEYWYHDFTGTVKLLFGGEQQQAFRNSVDKLYCYLRERNIPLNNATVLNLSLQVRTPESCEPYLRGRHALSVHVRLDFSSGDADAACWLEFEEGEAIPLLPGAMLISSGFRRHKVTGAAIVLHYDVALPELARVATLQDRTFHHQNLADTTVFAAATALPLSLPTPPLEMLQQKVEWVNRQAAIRYRLEGSPVVRRFLIDNAEPATATPEEIQLIRQHGLQQQDYRQTRVVDQVPVLSAQQCSQLKAYLDRHITAVVPDSVDGYPEYQVNLSIAQLTALLNQETLDKLLNLPSLLHDGQSEGENETLQFNLFLRIYSVQTRPYIAFHSDICTYTCVIALNDHQEFSGGQFLMMADDDQLRIAPWKTGHAVLHAGNLIHGVSNIYEGKRYSLVVFATRVE